MLITTSFTFIYRSQKVIFFLYHYTVSRLRSRRQFCYGEERNFEAIQYPHDIAYV